MNLHGTAVAVGGRGLLIIGPPGSGKSALALQMMALGARLVADDRVDLHLRDGQVIARCPAALAGLIEARGVGILRADPVPEAVLHLVADLGQTETDRLPDRHATSLLGARVDLVRASGHAHFPSALMLYLGGGRAE